jgi:chromosome partitioning protein
MTLQGPVTHDLNIELDTGSIEVVRDEHASVVVQDIARRRWPDAHVIVFANEKGGVGKSTLAFHCALSLAHAGKRVLTIDCDRRQQTLHRLLEARDATMRMLKVGLPRPDHVVLENQSGALLMQEIDRLGGGCDFVLVDLAGRDSPTARRAIALADTVVTPVNCSPADIDALGGINPVNRRLRQPSPFAAVVMLLQEERIARELGAFDWVVAKNRVRRCEQRLIASAERDLATMSGQLGFRLVEGLTERLAYRELLNFGLCHLDLKLIPGLGRARTSHSRELSKLVEGLHLPQSPSPRRASARPPVARRPQAPVSAQTADGYREALYAAASPWAVEPG